MPYVVRDSCFIIAYFTCRTIFTMNYCKLLLSYPKRYGITVARSIESELVIETAPIFCGIIFLIFTLYYRRLHYSRPCPWRHYDAIAAASSNSGVATDLVRQVERLFASEAMLVILSDLTGIRLHPKALSSVSC